MCGGLKGQSGPESGVTHRASQLEAALLSSSCHFHCDENIKDWFISVGGASSAPTVPAAACCARWLSWHASPCAGRGRCAQQRPSPGPMSPNYSWTPPSTPHPRRSRPRCSATATLPTASCQVGVVGEPLLNSASHPRLATVTPPSTHPVPTQYSHSTHTVPTQYPHSQDLASSGWTCWKLIPLCVLT